MTFLDLIKMALSNLWRRKMRTALTVLGVLIGTASIVVMMSMAVAQNKFMMESIANSRELVSITVRSKGGGYYEQKAGASDSKDKKTDDKAVEEIAALEHVKAVYPVLSTSVMVMRGPYQTHLSIEALPKAALEAMDLKYSAGGFPTEVEAGQLPIVIGNRVNEQFQNPNERRSYNSYEEGEEPEPNVNMYEQSVFVVYDTAAYNKAVYEKSGPMPKKYVMQASGIIDAGNSYGYGPHSYKVYTDLESLKHLYTRIFRGKAWPDQPKTKTGRALPGVVYTQLQVETEDVKYTKEVVDAIKKLEYQADSQLEFVESMKQNAARTQLLLGGIGGISLLVAAIGIANTMMMSIYERTREIGIFKVLGCSLPNIRNLFLLEAAFIGLIGGAVGLVVSFALSSLINTASSGGMMDGMQMSVIPLWLSGGSLIFGSIIGMISGLMPAIRAMRLSALEAIRTQ